MAANAETWLNRVVEQTSMNNGRKSAPDDVAAIAVRRSN
jgi:hypothetical protein